MKVKPVHILVLVALSAALFFVGILIQPHLQMLLLLKYDGVQYVSRSPGGPQEQKLLFGLALALFPLFSFTGWSLAKFTDTKEKQTFVGIQVIVFCCVMLYWFLTLKQQLEDLYNGAHEAGINMRITVPVESMKFSEFAVGSVIAGFALALILSGRIKKRSEVRAR